MNLDKKTQLSGSFIHVKTLQKREGSKDGNGKRKSKRKVCRNPLSCNKKVMILQHMFLKQ